MSLQNQDFLLTQEQLEQINTHIKSSYQNAVRCGRMLQLPKATICFEFTAILGRSVCVVF